MQEQLSLSPKRLIQDEATQWNTRKAAAAIVVIAAAAELEAPTAHTGP